MSVPLRLTRYPDPADAASAAVAAGFEIFLFGPMEVRVGGRPLPRLRSRKGMWLLALLALREGRDVDRIWLSGTLWPDCDEDDARRSLRQSLHDLRAALGPEAWRIQSNSPRTVRLDLSGAAVDTVTCDRLAARGDLDALTECAELLRGALLEGCSEEWVADERRRREAERIALLQQVAELTARAGDHAAAARYLQQAVHADPYREEARRALMRQLVNAGDSAAALQVYRDLRALLRSELMGEPAEETTGLYDEIRQASRSRAQSEAARPATLLPAPAEPSESVPPRTLPSPLTELIGRAESVRKVKQLLTGHRLVTLTGTGGIGKTRLGIQMAKEVQEELQNGAEFVSLAGVANPSMVPDAVREALNLRPSVGAHDPVDVLRQHLAARETLLVLDNCEHLLGACARLAETLLQQCPRLAILATSRQPLGLAGEAVWRVPSLAVPPADAGIARASMPDDSEGDPPGEDYAAVRLFAERARAAEGSFALTPDSTPAVIDICRRLDGIPLAIELVAARSRTLSIAEIRKRLDSGFAIVAGGEAIVPRHRTLEAAFLWSWDLLAPSEQLLLGRLSVFSGSWSLDAAESVCAGEGVESTDVLEIVTSLAEQSLVSYSTGGRYRLLETIRQFAGERLQATGDASVWRDRHLAHYLALAEEAEPDLTGAAQQETLDRLGVEHDNLGAALAWSRESEEWKSGGVAERKSDDSPDSPTPQLPNSPLGLRLAGAVWRYWDIRGHWREGRRWLAELLEAPTPDAALPARAKALFGAGILASRQGDLAAGRNSQEEGLALQRRLGDRRGVALALNELGNVASLQGELVSAQSLYDESLALWRELGDRRGLAMILNNLGNLATDLRDDAAAQVLHEESLEIRRGLGDPRGVAIALNNLGNLLREQGLSDRAVALHAECLSIQRQIGNRRGAAVALSNLGNDLLGVPDYHAADGFLSEGLAILYQMGDRMSLASTLEALAAARSGLGGCLQAACLWGFTERLREELGAPMPPNEAPRFRAFYVEARAGAAAEEFDAEWSRGRNLSLDEVVASAIGGSQEGAAPPPEP